MNLEEKLKEQIFYDVEQNKKCVLLSDALEIVEDAYSKEEVVELLKKYNGLIIAHFRDTFYPDNDLSDSIHYLKARNTIENAPQPKLKGE